MKKLNLIGQKFNFLTVISEAPKKKSYTAWNCQCECGKMIIVRTSSLTSDEQKSCGCLILNQGLALKPNQKFNRLTTISYDKGIWTCICDCGNYTKVMTGKLISGNTKSCGCLRQQEKSKELKERIGNSGRKYAPNITSARKVWHSYGYQDEHCDISFDDFYRLSQLNCNYCDDKPNTKYNGFLVKKDASQYAKDNGFFIYNGLDRIDPTKYHTTDNCAPCCYICNRAKNNRTLEEFYQYINSLVINDIGNFKYISVELPNNRYVLQSAKSAYRSYEKEGISLEEFYSLSQMSCFYCDKLQVNKVNAPMTDKKSSQKAKDEGWFLYNGLDKIDPTKSHILDNCVPCCKFCNFTKSNRSLEEFQAWIKRITKYRKIYE